MSLIISILIPNVIGFLGGLLGGSFNGFVGIMKPSFTPPNFVFPVVWTIIFILLGISSYIIYKSISGVRKSALIIYGIQLLINFLWNIFFFKLKLFLFSFFWTLLLLIVILIMVYKFYKIDKVSAYIQIPYILWTIFASILCYNVYLIN